jgi:hypothetical protein
MLFKIKLILTTFSLCFLFQMTIAQSYKEAILKGQTFKDIQDLGKFKNIENKVLNLHYAVYFVENESANHFFCLSKFQDHEKVAGDFQLKVIQTLPVEYFNSHLFTMRMEGCYLNGKKDNSLIAMTLKSETAELKDILDVWKVDKVKGRISPFPTKGVKCYQKI